MSSPTALRLLNADIDLLPGSGDDLRAAAAAIRSTRAALDLAVTSADKLGDLLAGDLWRGPAWTAFVGTVERHRLSAASVNAIERMEEAASAVEALASSHDRHQDQLRWCRGEFSAVVDSAVAGDEEAVRRADLLLDEAERIRNAHEHAEMELSAAFDRLDDATMFATPPDSLGDQVRSVAGTVWDAQWEFRIGAFEGLWSLGKTMAILTNPLAPVIVAHHLHLHREEYQAAFDHAVDNPGEFAREFGKAFVDWDTWAENPARAAGRLVPDLALTAMTWGAGGAAKGGVRVVDAGVDATRAAGSASRALDNATDAADAAGDLSRAGRVATDAAEDAVASGRWIDDLVDVNDAAGLVIDVDEYVTDIGESRLESNDVDAVKEKVGG